MKAFTINAFLLTALFSLVGCGNKQSNVSMKVTTGFNVTSAGYTGGLIAYGESSKGNRFAVSASGGQNLTVKIEDGAWKIYIVGWEDASGEKFKGTKYCGMTNVNLAAADADINVTVKPENCTLTDFQADAGIQNLLISSCGGFYNYNSSTNNYSPLTAADPDLFCGSLPGSLSYAHPYYKLVSTNIDGNTHTPGISTGCLETNPTVGNRVSIPTKKFPWAVQMYRSLKDCELATSTAFQRFGFPNGIDAGNQASFDQHFMTLATPEARLFLPSSFTRRGFSPFMNVQPRILCNNADCFSSGAAPSMASPFSPSEKVQWDVRWNNFSFQDDRTPTLIKGYKTSATNSTCDATTTSFLNQSPHFSVEGCKIEKGDLQGRFNRNAFTCRGTTDMGGMIDLYERDGKIYLVNTFPTNSYKVMVYSKSGVLLNEVNVPGTAYKSMAVDPAGTMFVLMDTISPPRTLHKFTYNSATKEYTAQTASTSSTLNSMEKIEAVATETLVAANTTDMRAFTFSGINSPGTLTAIPSSSSVQKLLYKNGFLYVLSHYTSTSQIHAVTVSGTSLAVGPVISPPAESSSFHISTFGAQDYLLLNPTNPGQVKIYQLNTNNTLGTFEASFTSSNLGHSAIMVGSNVYTMAGSTVNSASFSAWKFTPGSPTITTAHAPNLDRCDAQLTTTINSTAYKLNVSSRNGMNVKMVFEEAFRNIGHRFIVSPAATTYYESLQSHGDDDHGRSEGILGRASEMMGPDGLGGVINGIYPSQTCAQIKALATSSTATGGLNHNFVLNDSIRGETKKFSLNIMAETQPLNDFGDANPYDLILQISDPGVEKLKLKVNCTQRFGSLESADYEDSELRHELTIWNTVSGTNARYENYEIEDKVEAGVNKKRINISSLMKLNETDLVHRYLEINRDPTDIEGRLSETALELGKIMTSSLSTNRMPIGSFDTPNATPVNGYTVSNIIQNEELGLMMANAGSCTPVSSPDPTLTSETCPNVGHSIGVSSKDPTLSYNLLSLKDSTDGTATTASFYNLFTLTP